MKLKICGVRNQEMLDFCQDNQVDFCGFNFVPTSKRKINTDFFMPQSFVPKKVGIFMDQPLEVIIQTLEAFDLDVVQLHGHEDAIFLQKLKKSFFGLVVWKVFAIDEDFDLSMLHGYCKIVDMVLFDSRSPGTGSAILPEFEKKLEQALSFCEDQDIPYGMAGGIKAENIVEFKKKFPNADFLDTASGVEKSKVNSEGREGRLGCGKFDINTAQKLVENFFKNN